MRTDKGKTNFLIKVVIYILTFILLVLIGTGIGFMVGGGNFFQAFNWSTWQHLLDYFKR
ncbi:DNA-directed RNA polymerase subunit beta [Xylocopilactobacillus apis]|uniref:DNA-directed RNA polymerase subunit beta n=1 Tax=Xylocopilactobacillus apis TaxID=2932183 RepID=UPI0029532D05|nr:DNA-directed RNA polymerase subunit beta [Xylocopilactobacillus apis]